MSRFMLGAVAVATATVTATANNFVGDMPVVGYPEVDTTLGRLRGLTVEYEGKHLNSFRGIRYTEPPVNERRFLRSELINKSWEGVQNATSYGAVCIQNPAADPNMHVHPEAPPPNEDCLYVNVFTPVSPSKAISEPVAGPHEHDRGSLMPTHAHGVAASEPAALLPVLVWIHGGGLCIGSSSEAWSTGYDLIKEENVVLVNFNYRLGALGFMVSNSSTRGGLPDDKFVGNGGMNGIYDQIVALQWIQREIVNFGGDPDRVTVFGDSAGGYSICTLSVAPPAAGLFQRSVVHSGPCVGGWGPLNVSYGHRVTAQILANHSADSIADLQSPSIDPATIQWPDYTMDDLTVAPYFSAYFFDEGGVLPARPEELFRNISRGEGAKLNSADFIIGTTSRDGTAQFYGTVPALPNNSSESIEKIYMDGLVFAWGEKAARIAAQYPLESYHNSPQEAMIAADGDAYVICPSRAIARAVSADKQVPTYVFEFSHFKSHFCDPAQVYYMVNNFSSHPGWASHGSDVQYIHGTTFGPDWNSTRVDCPYAANETGLVRDMQTRWRNFATNGSVNTGLSNLEWTPYLANGPGGSTSVLQFASEGEVGGTRILENDREDNCAFWAKELPSLRTSE